MEILLAVVWLVDGKKSLTVDVNGKQWLERDWNPGCRMLGIEEDTIVYLVRAVTPF